MRRGKSQDALYKLITQASDQPFANDALARIDIHFQYAIDDDQGQQQQTQLFALFQIGIPLIHEPAPTRILACTFSP